MTFLFPQYRNAVNIVEEVSTHGALPERVIIGLALKTDSLSLAALYRTGRFSPCFPHNRYAVSVPEYHAGGTLAFPEITVLPLIFLRLAAAVPRTWSLRESRELFFSQNGLTAGIAKRGMTHGTGEEGRFRVLYMPQIPAATIDRAFLPARHAGNGGRYIQAA
jgi:hypothetical protein